MKKQATIQLNEKQLIFHRTVCQNQADFLKGGDGYQGGFRATFQGGRASGKTWILQNLIAESAFQLPGARAGLAGLTYRQVQDIILSQSSRAFEQHGLREYNPQTGIGHYVINRRPPEHWRKAHNPIRTYDNSLIFANGYTVQFISADRPETARGANLDQIFIDESATIKQQFYNRVLRPTLRANKAIYKDPRPGRRGLNHPLHWLIADFTSAPWLPDGRWIYDTEELQKQHPERYFFLQSTAYDNLMHLPGNFIEDQRESCGDELTFNVEILNHRLDRLPNGFYYALSDTHAYDLAYSYEFDDEKRLHVPTRLDYDPKRGLELSWDFNAQFTSCLIAQDFHSEYRFIDAVWVKASKQGLVDQLCDDIIKKYSGHRRKEIMLFGDTGANKKDPGRNKTYKEQIIGKFRAAGWAVTDRVQASYPPYHTRYNVVNSILKEDNTRIPKVRINGQECKALLIALGAAPIDGTSFEKVKSSEDMKSLPQEYATHLTDAFDYVLYSKFAKLVKIGGGRSGGLVIR